jgi:N6-adenosine-specific RNA methylase IME4
MPVPGLKYRTIVADPPWSYERMGGNYAWREGLPSGDRITLAYHTMSVAEIESLPVQSLADTDAHLYLWTTQRYLREAYTVARAWGFKPSCALVWCKRPTGFNIGGTFMSTVEFCLFCRRGSLKAKTRVQSQWFEWPRGTHSAKPEAFIDLVEQVSPGPYVELFSRRHRLGWDVWGNESANTATLEAS